jgi:hypothetical protein
MDIHKPKPVRSWREFLKEYAIIVIGVLTALAGEQAVEKLRERSRAVEARASVHAEISRNLGLMERREKSETCLKKRLDEIEGLVAASAAGQKLPDTIWLGTPSAFIMQDGKYKSALSSGSASLFNEQEQAAYADLYASFATYWQTAVEEQKTWASLRVLESHPAPSPALDWQLRNALQQARFARYFIELGRRVSLMDGRAIGVKPIETPNRRPTMCFPLNTARGEVQNLLPANNVVGASYQP